MARELPHVFTFEELKAACLNADLTAARNSTLANYREPFTDKLIGKELVCKFDDGVNITFIFKDINTVSWSENGSPLREEYYEGLESTVKNVFGIHFFRSHTVPFEGAFTIFDMDTGLVTWTSLHIGTPDSDKDITPKVHFGEIEGYSNYPEHHHYSNDLVGTIIDWKYGDKFTIQHAYVASHITISPAPPETPEEGYLFRKFLPTIHVKIRNGLYMASFVEPGGSAAVLLIDINSVHDIGCFYGINHECKLNSVTLAAHGAISKIGFNGKYAI